MITKFSVTNYRSFKNSTTIDFFAKGISDHKERIKSAGKSKILNASLIYGANASGKSNLLDALHFMKLYVKDNLKYTEEDNKNSDEYRISRVPFEFDNSYKKNPSIFEINFMVINSGKYTEYNYGFSLNDDQIIEEWLNKKTKNKFFKVFYRENNKVDIKDNKKELEKIIDRISLVLSYGSKFKIKDCVLVREAFNKIAFVDFGDTEEDVLRARSVPANFENESVQKSIINYFSSFDKSIVNFDVKLIDNIKKNGKVLKKFTIKSGHHKNNSKDIGYIPFEQESSGTLKMFSLFSPIRKTLDNGGSLVIDELNAKLHPLLVRNILISFLDPRKNPNHAQIIFTTHEPWLLSCNLLRRDEIWFTVKENNGNSILYSLYDIVDIKGNKIRNDENFEKNYLYGKYGAIPELKDLFD